MPAAHPITGHINGLITASPDEALAAAAALVAVGAGLTLRHCVKSLGMREQNFTGDENREIDLLDQNAPEGFWSQAATGVYAGLVQSKFAPSIKPRLRWLKGLWAVDHCVNVGSEVEPVTLVDLTTVATPALKGDVLA